VRIGIFGGSFNPIHKGHLFFAETAYSELNLDQIFFVPTFSTPLKERETLLPARLRLTLLKKALRGRPYFKISLCEMNRKGVSFTVDTLRYFRKRFKKKATLYFLAGADTLKNFSRWKSPEEVLESCRFVVTDRPGHKTKMDRDSILYLLMKALPISASDIRRRLKNRDSIRGLVPEGTEKLLADYYKGGLRSKRMI